MDSNETNLLGTPGGRVQRHVRPFLPRSPMSGEPLMPQPRSQGKKTGNEVAGKKEGLGGKRQRLEE